jgi:polyphosphate kinase
MPAGENGSRSYDSPTSKNRPERPLNKSEIPNDAYAAQLFRLQTEFVKLQEWVRLRPRDLRLWLISPT